MKMIALTCACLVAGVHSVAGAQSSSGGAQPAKSAENVPPPPETQPTIHLTPGAAPRSIPRHGRIVADAAATTVTPTSTISVDQHLAAGGHSTVGTQRWSGRPQATRTASAPMTARAQPSVPRPRALAPTSIPRVALRAVSVTPKTVPISVPRSPARAPTNPPVVPVQPAEP